MGDSNQAERPRNPFSSAPPVGDFYAPFFTVEFTNPEEQSSKKTGADGQTGGKPGGIISSSAGETRYNFTDNPEMSRLRSFASSLEVTSVGGAACTATLVLEPPYYEAIHICEARAVQQKAIMSCQWGYLPGGPGAKAIVSRWHHFVLQKPPTLSVSGTDVSITIVGIDAFSNVAMKRESRTVYIRSKGSETKKAEHAKTEHKGTRKGTRNVPDGKDDHTQGGTFSTDLKILEHLAKKPGMTVNTSLVPKSSMLFKDRTKPAEQDKPDWAFFLELCVRNKCDFYTEGGVIYLVDTNTVKVQQTSYRLLLMRQPETDRDIPMQEFSTDALANMFTPAAAAEVRRLSADPDSGIVVDLTIDPAERDDQQFAGKLTAAGLAVAAGKSAKLSDDTTLIPNPAFSATETGKHVTSPHGYEGGDEQAAMLARSSALLANMDARATVPGVPSLIPWMLVEVLAGFPTTFDGPFMVKKVTHRLGTDGYSMELELHRDTTSASTEGSGSRPSTGGNTPPAQESGAGEAVTSTDENGRTKA